LPPSSPALAVPRPLRAAPSPTRFSPAPVDLGAGHRAAGHALLRWEVTRPAPASCEPPAVRARRSTIADAPPCPSGRTGEGDGRQDSTRHRHRRPAPCPSGRLKPLGGRGRPEVRQPTRAVAAIVLTPPRSATHTPCASVPTSLGRRDSVLCEVRLKTRAKKTFLPPSLQYTCRWASAGGRHT
jgi:hypothetical protein